jgi:hypothetical protein
MVISFLVIAIIYSPSATFGIPNMSNEAFATCTPTGKQTSNGGQEVECCWEAWSPNVGPAVVETYCSTCENGGTRGMINCSDPELQYLPVRGEDITGLPDEGVFDQPPTPTSPFAPPVGGGVLQQPTTTTPTTPPSLFGRNVPLQGGGVFGQQPAAIAPPTPVPTPILTPEPPVPMFGSTQQQAAPTLPPTGDEGLTGVAPRTVEPLTQTCPVGNVWDPNIMICVPDLPPLTPPQLCPDGSIPQSTGPSGIRPECPPFETEQPQAEEQEEEPQDEGQEEPDEGQETAGPLT